MRAQLPQLDYSKTNWRLTPEENERLTRRFGDTVSNTPEDCLTCHGRKWFRWYNLGNRTDIVEYDCPCVDQYKMHRYFLYHGIPTMYQVLGWADVHADVESIAATVNYWENRTAYFEQGLGLFLYGDLGTGKSMLGSFLLKRFLADGLNGYYTSFVDLLSDRSSGWTNPEDRDYFIRQIRNCKVLLIDDPGKEQKTSERQIEYATSALDEVVRFRVSMLLPTIITSNYDPETFGSHYSRYVQSLVSESMIVQKVTGLDFRGRVEERKRKEAERGLSRPVVVE